MIRPAARQVAIVDSPVGPLRIEVDDEDRLSGIAFADASEPSHIASSDSLREIVSQLEQYFRGERRQFELEIAPQGTSFQRKVWDALRSIPFGETWSYADLARAIGNPGATRAVGQANGRNPIPIVIPCHRVIAQDGTIGGYSAGRERKDFLLALEGCPPKRKRGAEAPRSNELLFP